MDVSKNKGNPKSSILIGFSIINHPFWGTTIFGNIHIDIPKIAGKISLPQLPVGGKSVAHLTRRMFHPTTNWLARNVGNEAS